MSRHPDPIPKNEITSLSISIDYTIPTTQLLAQHHFRFNNNSAKHAKFEPIPKLTTDNLQPRVDLHLVPALKVMNGIEGIFALCQDGFRPCIAEEIVMFALQVPEFNSKFPIVALGSWWERNVLIIWPDLDRGHIVDLWPYRTYFRAGDLFAAVRM